VALALVPIELSASPSGIVLPSFDSEKSKNVHTSTIIKNENGTGESDDVPFHNYIVEDSDDLKKARPSHESPYCVSCGKESWG
jgi:hypothetical protein